MSRNIIIPPYYGRRPYVGATGMTAAQLASAINAVLAANVILIGDGPVLNASGVQCGQSEFCKTWQDLSGNNAHAVQNTTANQPIFVTDVGAATGLTPNRGFTSQNGVTAAYMEGPLVNSSGVITAIMVGYEFSGGPWVGSCAGTTGLTDISATAIRFFDNPSAANIRSRQNAVNTATVTELDVKRSIYRSQLTGSNLVVDVDGVIQSAAATPTLGTTIYGIHNDPTKVGTAFNALFLMYFHAIWNSNMSGGNFASISALLKSYYNTT
jgi:hypothetical protein